MGQPVCTSIQFSIGEPLIFKYQGGGAGIFRYDFFEQLGNGLFPWKVGVSRIPRPHLLDQRRSADLNSSRSSRSERMRRHLQAPLQITRLEILAGGVASDRGTLRSSRLFSDHTK